MVELRLDYDEERTKVLNETWDEVKVMNLGYLAKNLKLVERNREWWASPLSLWDKVGYYPSIFMAYVRLFAAHRKSVRYLRKAFYYDNPATPLNLQNYPYELGIKILGNMNLAPRKILDVGANIGQFACTLAYFVPDCEIDCLEPNPTLLATLKNNLPENVRIFGWALGPKRGTETMYFEPNRSGVGSFLKKNAGTQGHLEKVVVPVEDDAARITKCHDYDLIKVDVEGFEFDAVKALKNMKAKYLYVEVSGGGRDKPFTDARLYSEIAKTLGDFNVIYSNGISPTNATYELLLEFV
jgi:FkbM family methyltransferase